MKSRVDESDADSPQDEPLTGSGAPAARQPTPLDELFGRAEKDAAPTSAASESDTREQLARLFARSSAPAGPAELRPAADAAGPAAAFSASTAAATSAPEEQHAAAVPAVEDVEDAALDDDPDEAFDEAATEAAVDEPDFEQPEAWTAIDDAEADARVEELTGEAAFAELGLDEIVADERAEDEVAEDEAGPEQRAVDEPAVDEPGFEDPAIAATAVATAVVAEAPLAEPPVGAASTEPRALGWLFDSPVPAEPEPSSHNGTFAPARPQGVRGTLFGSRWRTATSAAVSIVLVLGLIAGAAVIAQTWSANARLAEAQAALNSAQGDVRGPAASVETASTQYDETLLAAHAAADGATPALAAVAGMTDQATLDAANVALAELVVALDEPAPSPPPAPYEGDDVDVSDINEVTAAAGDARDYAEKATAATIRLETAQAELALRLGALTDTRNALGASLPATAAAIADENAKAEQSFRDAVIAAAAAVGAAQAAGGSGDAELHAYAAAVTALRADQARALAEEQSRSQTRPRTTNPGTTPTPTPTPSPEAPPETTPDPPPDPPTDPPPPPP